MPVLPSFINKGKRNKFKVTTKYPFSSLRPNFPTLHPFGSSDVIDIHDKSTSHEDGDEEFVSKGSFDLDDRRVHYEPLDLNISPEPLMSSFPPGFLKNSYIHPADADSPHIRDKDNRRGVIGGGANNTNTPIELLRNGGFDMADEDAEELIAKLQGMDASSFVGMPSSSSSPPLVSHFDDGASSWKSTRKTALVPITTQTSPGGKHQALDSEHGGTYPSQSPVSSPASSAVSGSTLARALISNTFVLSIDTRDSRKYRSGISTLTRTDSAILPMEENPFFSHERKLSGDGLLPWANNPKNIPPVPPMPSEAELLILASKASSPPTYRRQTGDFRRNASTGSLDSTRSREISAPVASSSVPISAIIDSVSAGSVQASRRISRISANSVTVIPLHRSDEKIDKNKESPIQSPSPSPPIRRVKSQEVPKPLPPLPGRTEEASSRELDNVIDYYSSPSPEATQKGFQPAFSPITEVSEMTGTSTSFYKKRYSQMSSVISPFTPSPLSAGYTPIRGGPSRSMSESQARFRIRDRPHSLLVSPSNSDAFGALPVGEFYKRKRSGSTPSPIVVVRDTQDLSKYNITLSPGSAAGPLTGATQTFPQTPSLYSPAWTPGPLSSSSIQQRLYQEVEAQLPPFPYTPTSARLPFSNLQTSLTQTMLMTRAASGARHYRQSSLTRNRDLSGTNTHKWPLTEEKANIKKEDVNAASSKSQDRPTGLNDLRVTPAIDGSPSLSVGSYAGSNDGQASLSSRGGRSRPASPVDSIITNNFKSADRLDHRQESSSITNGDDSTQEHFSDSGNINLSRNASQSSSKFSALDAQHSSESLQTPSTQSVPTARPSLNTDSPVIPPSLLHSSKVSTYTRPQNTSDSPPPYDTVFNDRLARTSRTPSTPGFDFPQAYRYSPHIAAASQSRESLNQGAQNSRRQRQRPRLPAGPRERRDGKVVSQPVRDRNGSISSITSTLPSISRVPTMSMQSPRFNVPSPKFKGLTMEAAKWTFTSAELQAIVSRAIQQSAEALSIRLLHLETLDNDIPEDLCRLEVERRDIQAKYRTLSHRRNKLLDLLSNNFNSHTAESPGSTFRVVEALRDISGQLDQLAESLHSVDEQIARLNTLVLKHSGSALAMALRKLNKSFLEKLAELEHAKHETVRLEVERDEAFKQAEEAVQKVHNANIGVCRKPSVRRFKASFHSASRRSSYNSSRMSNGSMHVAGVRSPPFVLEDAPPVPPVPQNKPYQIYTDIPLRSANPLSTAGVTPSSPDARTLLEQEALYVDIERHIGARLRRSRSSVTFLTSDDLSRRPTSPIPHGKPFSRIRRASLPGDFRLSEAYKAMNADSNAMLLTLRMLSDTAA